MSGDDFGNRPWEAPRPAPPPKPLFPPGGNGGATPRPPHEKAYTAGAIALVGGIFLYAISNRGYSLCQSVPGQFAQMFSSQTASQCSTASGAHLLAVLLILGGLAGIVTGIVLANKNKS
jgi:hypothetical protein